MHQPAILSDSDATPGSAAGDAPMLSDSDSEAEQLALAANRTCKVKEVLRSWGIEGSAEDVPILLLPDPIGFLIFQRKWTSLILRTKWHLRLIDRHGVIYSGKQLLHGVLVF